MRLSARTQFVMLQLAVISLPAFPLGYLCVAWLPSHRRADRLELRVERLAADVRCRGHELESLRRRARAAQSGVDPAAWLTQRDTRRAFDEISSAFAADGISLERVNIMDPIERFDPDQRQAIHRERIEVSCGGSFEAVTSSLDRFERLAVPRRISALTMSATDGRVSLAMRAEVPYRAVRPEEHESSDEP